MFERHAAEGDGGDPGIRDLGQGEIEFVQFQVLSGVLEEAVAEMPQRRGRLEFGNHAGGLERGIGTPRDRPGRDRLEPGKEFTPFRGARLEDFGPLVVGDEGDPDLFGHLGETVAEEAFGRIESAFPVFIAHFHRGRAIEEDDDGSVAVGIVLPHDETRKDKDREGEKEQRHRQGEPAFQPSQPGRLLMLAGEGFEKDERGDAHLL